MKKYLSKIFVLIWIVLACVYGYSSAEVSPAEVGMTPAIKTDNSAEGPAKLENILLQNARQGKDLFGCFQAAVH